MTIRAVRFQAPGSNARCPVAINALGFCAIKVERCHIEGFEFPVQFSDGAQGMISDCVIWSPTVLALLEAVTELRGDPELNATNEGVTILWLT